MTESRPRPGPGSVGTPRGFLFDVFGTVVDWRRSVARGLASRLAPLGVAADWAALADGWRARYDPSMAPVRAGRRDWVVLDALHRESLEDLLAAEGLGPFDAAVLDDLTWLWHRLEPWPDAREGLRRLGTLAPCATCSNGHIAMIVAMARAGGLRWDAVLGAEIARDYKPAPAVYLASAPALGLAPGAAMMVAAHNADLAAARAAGLRTAFVRRPAEHGPGQSVDLEPEGDWDVVADDLVDLATRLGG